MSESIVVTINTLEHSTVNFELYPNINLAWGIKFCGYEDYIPTNDNGNIINGTTVLNADALDVTFDSSQPSLELIYRLKNDMLFRSEGPIMIDRNGAPVTFNFALEEDLRVLHLVVNYIGDDPAPDILTQLNFQLVCRSATNELLHYCSQDPLIIVRGPS
ncbi:hypothetical protein KIH87_02780 [Paraneptunicella aestuarii]|uniref:hypothetical protein n=1 Tax=Paraneptunicella aestuarii TaxID=2831148 RepID=UPI001E5AB896|nr:hypothetical protein [Paraneptunicella aestuarii]UAA39307.1 hypothetical protein KIH87_02780 [Paraneptunicella aestuarii]